MKTTKFIQCITLILLLIFVSFTNIVSSNAPHTHKMISPVSQKLIQIKNLIAEVKTIVNILQIQYQHPQLVATSHIVLENLDALFIQWPVFVCAFLLRTSEALYDLSDQLYTLGFLLMSQLAGKFSQIIYIFLFGLHCEDYYPYSILELSMFQPTAQMNTHPLCSCGK